MACEGRAEMSKINILSNRTLPTSPETYIYCNVDTGYASLIMNFRLIFIGTSILNTTPRSLRKATGYGQLFFRFFYFFRLARLLISILRKFVAYAAYKCISNKKHYKHKKLNQAILTLTSRIIFGENNELIFKACADLSTSIPSPDDRCGGMLVPNRTRTGAYARIYRPTD